MDSNHQASNHSQAVDNTILTEKHGENSKTHRVPNQVLDSDVIAEIAEKIGQLTADEKRLIMELLKK